MNDFIVFALLRKNADLYYAAVCVCHGVVKGKFVGR
jgi:hypothetical protein